jgi:GT2 family glycosyltransferase
MMVPLQVIRNTAPMPELYFLYYEEHDWCALIKRAGYDIYFVADSVVYHKESVSVGKNSPLKTYYMTRNRLLYMRRNTKGFTKYFSIFFYFAVAMPKALLMFFLKREFHLLKPFYAGLRWNFGHKNVQKNPELIWNDNGSRAIKRPYPVPKKQF